MIPAGDGPNARPVPAPLVLVVGASTGGPDALVRFLRWLPARCGFPILIAQHILPRFSAQLAEQLTVRCRRTVQEAADGVAVQPDAVYMAPAGRHLSVSRAGSRVLLKVTVGPPENFCRPSVNVLLRSAAHVYGDGVLAVILTGMGSDGLEGCRHVFAAGGTILAQDEESSVVWGMPGAVVHAGLAGAELPPERLATAVAWRLRTANSAATAGIVRQGPGAASPPLPGITAGESCFNRDEALRTLLTRHAGLRLTEEYLAIVRSRIEACANAEGYPDARRLLMTLLDSPFGPLHQRVIEAVTIHETSFFRDGHPFTSFRDVVLPALHDRRKGGGPLNIWSAACSTGQEAYSIAMILEDHPLYGRGDARVLGSDLCPNIVAIAGSGRYSALELSRGLTERLRSRHFVREDETYRLAPEIRGWVEFRTINLLEAWPPLSAMDVVFLRNVLIYLEGSVRNDIYRRLRGLMRPGGWLALGAAEAPGPGFLESGFERVGVGPSTWYRRVGA